MVFSDDEDFFARAGQDEDEGMPFEEYESCQPPDEDVDVFGHEAMGYCEEPRAPLQQIIEPPPEPSPASPPSTPNTT